MIVTTKINLEDTYILVYILFLYTLFLKCHSSTLLNRKCFQSVLVFN